MEPPACVGSQEGEEEGECEDTGKERGGGGGRWERQGEGGGERENLP